MYIGAMSPKDSLIIVADSHIHGGAIGKADEFFKMLEHFKRLHHDIVFLGDIFELWIALEGYEGELHRRFLDWSREAMEKRSVGFIEGNHEYFVGEERKGFFTWVSDSERLLEGGTLFAHGDLINVRDRKYRLLRLLVRNGVSKAIMKLASGSLGPRLAEKLRSGLKKTNMEHKKGLPSDLMELFSERKAAKGVKRILVGHFHQPGGHKSKSGVELSILPSWRDAGAVGLLDKASGKLELRKWKEV